MILAIASNLLNVFMAFSRDENEGFLNGAICSIPAVRYELKKMNGYEVFLGSEFGIISHSSIGI